MANEYTNSEVISLLGTTSNTFIGWKNTGKIAFRNEGRKCLISIDSVLAFLSNPENKRYLDRAIKNIGLLKPEDASRLRQIASIPKMAKNTVDKINIITVLTNEIARLNGEEARIADGINILRDLRCQYAIERTTFGLGEVDTSRFDSAVRSIDNSIELLKTNKRLIVSTRGILEEELANANKIFMPSTMEV